MGSIGYKDPLIALSLGFKSTASFPSKTVRKEGRDLHRIKSRRVGERSQVVITCLSVDELCPSLRMITVYNHLVGIFKRSSERHMRLLMQLPICILSEAVRTQFLIKDAGADSQSATAPRETREIVETHLIKSQ